PYWERVIGACPDTYEAAKDLVVKMKKYNCDREYISKSLVQIATEEEDEILFDIRNLGKRQRSIEDEVPVTHAAKKRKR
ncbi:14084_t:CDS:2, partial [Gigaspora margarita]